MYYIAATTPQAYNIGMASDPRIPQPAPSAEQSPEIAHLRDFSFVDIVQRLPMPIATVVLEHQEAEQADPTSPLNSWVDVIPEESAELLIQNEEIYDDEVEDFIDLDRHLTQLIEWKRQEKNSEQMAIAIRARRTVLVRYLLEVIAQQSSHSADNAA